VIKVFLNVIVPVGLVAGAGFLFGRFTKYGTEPLTKLSFYVLSPALIFHSLITHSITTEEFTHTVTFVAIAFAVLFALSLAVPRFLRWDQDTRAASVLTLCLNNNGNYGLPVLLFAFGEAGFTLGVIYMVTQMAFVVIFGVGVASWHKGVSLSTLPLSILKVPWFYAFALALIVRAFSIGLPLTVSRPIELLAQAAIPLQLLLLGMALSRFRVEGLLRQAALLTAAKLLIPPVLAWGVTAALGIEGLLRAVLIVQASTPTAVNALILSLQYNRRPDLVASVTLLTTLGNLATMSVLLSLLQ
jgi:predicted permease